MKTRLILLTVILVGSVSFGLAQKNSKENQAVKILAELEKTAWKNLVDKKYDVFAKLLADDYQGVYPEAATTKASEMTLLRQMTFKTADVTDTRVTFPAANTAIVTSLVKMEVVMPGGQTMTDNMRATSIIVKRGAKWLIVYHSHVPVRTM